MDKVVDYFDIISIYRLSPCYLFVPKVYNFCMHCYDSFNTEFFCSSGGVELIAKDGKIRVVNTLESRLDLLSRQVSFGVGGIFGRTVFGSGFGQLDQVSAS